MIFLSKPIIMCLYHNGNSFTRRQEFTIRRIVIPEIINDSYMAVLLIFMLCSHAYMNSNTADTWLYLLIDIASSS